MSNECETSQRTCEPRCFTALRFVQHDNAVECYCHNLKKIYSRIPGDSVPAIDEGVFDGIGRECVLYVPRGAKVAYRKTAGWNHFKRIVEMDM